MREVFGELLIPVVKDIPFFQSVNVDIAARYSDYVLSGGTNTYKGDVDWAVMDGWRLRGGYERAIRAPSVNELFAGNSTYYANRTVQNSSGAGDPCDIRLPTRTGPNGAAVRALCLAEGLPAASYRHLCDQRQSGAGRSHRAAPPCGRKRATPSPAAPSGSRKSTVPGSRTRRSRSTITISGSGTRSRSSTSTRWSISASTWMAPIRAIRRREFLLPVRQQPQLVERPDVQCPHAVRQHRRLQDRGHRHGSQLADRYRRSHGLGSGCRHVQLGYRRQLPGLLQAADPAGAGLPGTGPDQCRRQPVVVRHAWTIPEIPDQFDLHLS